MGFAQRHNTVTPVGIDSESDALPLRRRDPKSILFIYLFIFYFIIIIIIIIINNFLCYEQA